MSLFFPSSFYFGVPIGKPFFPEFENRQKRLIKSKVVFLQTCGYIVSIYSKYNQDFCGAPAEAHRTLQVRRAHFENDRFKGKKGEGDESAHCRKLGPDREHNLVILNDREAAGESDN